jgi:hypothetical protein
VSDNKYLVIAHVLAGLSVLLSLSDLRWEYLIISATACIVLYMVAAKENELKMKIFSSGNATFELGNVKNEITETLGLALTTSSLPDGALGFTKEELVCELTKRATVQAISKFSKIEAQFVTVKLVNIECI